MRSTVCHFKKQANTKIMKISPRIASLLITLLLSFQSKAQDTPVNVDLAISPPYALELEAYLEYEFNIVMTITNTGPSDLDLKFAATLQGDNGITVSTDISAAPPEAISLASGQTRIFTGDDFSDLYIGFQESDIIISGASPELRAYVYNNRILPEGNYTLCIIALDYETNTELSMGEPLGCSEFEIIFPDRPIITTPLTEETISSNPTQTINISWLAPGTASPDILLRTHYDLKIVDMTRYPELTPEQAMLDPGVDFILLETDLEGNNFIAEDLDLIEGNNYAFRVTAFDEEGTIAYQFDGHSEVVVAQYGTAELSQNLMIIKPLDEATVDYSDNPQFFWSLPTVDGEVPDNMRTILAFVDITEHGLDPINSLAEFNTNKDFQSVIGIDDSRTTWSADDSDHETAGLPLNLIHSHIYSLHIYAVPEGTPFSDATPSEFIHFTYSSTVRPTIITPTNEGILSYGDDPHIQWTLPIVEGEIPDDVRTVISIIDLTSNGLEPIKTPEEFNTSASLQSVIGVDNSRTSWNISDTDVVKDGVDLVFAEGNRYTMLVKCAGNGTLISEGYESIYHTFTYSEGGEEDEEHDCILEEGEIADCSAPVTELYFPPNSDTIPFDYVPFMIKFDPYCEDYKQLNYEYSLYSQPSTEIDSRTDELRWGPGGPLQYLIDQGITDANEDRARYFMMNDNASTPILQRAEAYKFTAEGKMKMRDGTEHEFDLENSFVAGMPTPGLFVPENLDTIRPGEISFRWDNGMIPYYGFPDVSHLIRMHGSSFEDATIFGVVNEQWIIQISTTENFEAADLVAASSDVVYASNVSSQEDLFGTIYLTNEISKTISTPGKYYWRVIWLKEPGGSVATAISEDNPASHFVNNEAFYHSSPVRSFVLNPDADSEITPEEGEVAENEETDCTTACELPEFSMTASSSIGEITSFKAGYFSVNEVEITSNSGGRLTGEGEVKIDFMFDVKVKVEFTNIRLNSELRLVEGEVTAKQEDTPFNLGDINSSISSGAEVTGVDGQVNNWLEENADEGRIVSAFVSDRAIGMPIGIERDIKDHKLLIGVTGFTFGPSGATVKLLYEQHFEKMRTDQWLSLAGEVCIKPSGFGAEVLLHMNRDLVIEDYWEEDPEERDIKYIIKGSSSSDPSEIRANATHIEFQCACVKSFAIRMEAEFDEDKLVKDTDAGTPGTGPVKAYLDFSLNRERACENEDEREELSEEVAERYRANNFMVRYTMDPFQIKGLEGWGFHVTEGYFDFSSVENPEGMTFPADYDHAALSPPDGASSAESAALSNTWTGFYMKQISVKAPSDFYENNADRRLHAGIENLFIDDTGFSGEIFAENIVSLGEGEVDKCKFSIDDFRLRIIQNTFREGELSGKFAIPITDEDTPYEAVLAYTVPDDDDDESSGSEDAEPDAEWGFFMSIKPSGKINTPAFMGSITLEDNSYVHVKYGEVPEEFVDDEAYDEEREGFALFFDGEMDFTTSSIGESDLATEGADTNTPFSFTGMKFDLTYNNIDGFDWNHAWASPQKYMGGNMDGLPPDDDEEGVMGFPVSISDLSITSRFGDGRCIGADLGFTIAINLMDDDDGGFAASSDMSLGASYDLERKRFVFDGLYVSCITVGASTSGGTSESGGTESSGVTFEGELCFYDEDPYCGEIISGIKGKLEIGLPVATIDLEAMFASTGEYRFWYVDGKAVATDGAKIAQIGALDLIGLSGGIYYNMRLENGGSPDANGYNSQLVSNANALHGEDTSSDDECVTASGFRAVPSEGSYIFKVGLALATSGDHSVFNMDVGATAAITRGRGLTHFGIIGSGYIMAKVSERPTAPIVADINITFDKYEDRKVFDAGFAIYVDFEKDPLFIKGISSKTSFDGVSRSQFVHAHFHLESPNVGDAVWAFKMGSPRDPGGLEARVSEILRFRVRNYIQVGNNVDEDFMSLPPLITKLLDLPTEGDSQNGLAGGDRFGGESERGFGSTAMVSTGQGFIMGLSAELDIDLDAFLLYATFRIALGFDINVLKYEGGICYTSKGETIDPIGNDGWYATGQMYAGVQGEVGIQIKFFGTHRIHLFRLGAAFLIQGGFPNPVWAEGRAGVHYSVLGGLFEGSANFNFSVGEKCVPPRTDPFGFAVINEFMPAHNATNVSPFTRPRVSFNLPINEVLEIPVLEENSDGESVPTVERLKPLISKIELRNADNNQIVELLNSPYSLNSDKTVATVNRKNPQENKRLKLYVKLKAERLEGSVWRSVRWPAASGRTGYWSEDSTIVFRTGDLPERIPMEMVKDGNPIPMQRYFLKGAPNYISNGKVQFFDALGSTYFKPSDENGNYTYKVKFYDMNGSDPLESPIDLNYNQTAINFNIPAGLENNEIYNLQVVRIKNSNDGNTIAGGDGIFGSIPGLDAMSNNDHLGTQWQQSFLMEHNDIRFTGLFNKMDFVSRARKLIPGEDETDPDETVLLVYPFKTSSFNTLPEKLQGSDAEMTMLTSGSGEFTSAEPWVELRSEEGFDVFDLLGFTKVQDGRTYKRGPLVALMPDFNNNFWNYKAKPVYNKILPFLKHMNYNSNHLYEKSASLFLLNSNLKSGVIDAKINMGRDLPLVAEIQANENQRLMSLYQLEMNFISANINRPYLSRFKTIDPTTVRPRLSEAEVQAAWDQTVMQMADEMEEESTGVSGATISNSSSTSLGGITGIGGTNISSSYGLGLGSVLGSVDFSEMDFRATTRFYFDFNAKVQRDMSTFKVKLFGMYYNNVRLTLADQQLNFGYLQREHIINKYPYSLNALMSYWTSKNSSHYSVVNSPGTYKFKMNYLISDINEMSVTDWSSPDINFNMNN